MLVSHFECCTCVGEKESSGSVNAFDLFWSLGFWLKRMDLNESHRPAWNFKQLFVQFYDFKVALVWIPGGQVNLMGWGFQPVLLLQCNSGFAWSLGAQITSESKNYFCFKAWITLGSTKYLFSLDGMQCFVFQSLFSKGRSDLTRGSRKSRWI